MRRENGQHESPHDKQRRIKPAIDDWRKLLGDTAAVTAMLDCLLHHGHIPPNADRIAGRLGRKQNLDVGKAMSKSHFSKF